MARPERTDSARRTRSAAQQHRDAALRRIGRTRAWLIAAAGALTAAIAGLVSAVAPGKTLGAKRTLPAAPVASSTGSAAASTAMPPLATPAQLGLQTPGQAPGTPQQSAPPQIDPSQVAPPAQPDPTQVAPAYSGGGAVVSGGS